MLSRCQRFPLESTVTSRSRLNQHFWEHKLHAIKLVTNPSAEHTGKKPVGKSYEISKFVSRPDPQNRSQDPALVFLQVYPRKGVQEEPARQHSASSGARERQQLLCYFRIDRSQ